MNTEELATALAAIGVLNLDEEDLKSLGQFSIGALGALWQSIKQRLCRRSETAKRQLEAVEKGDTAVDLRLVKELLAAEQKKDENFRAIIQGLLDELAEARKVDAASHLTATGDQDIKAVGSIVHGSGIIRVDGDIVGGSKSKT